MSSLFGSGDVSADAKKAQTPAPFDVSVRREAQMEIRKRARSGRASTFLMGRRVRSNSNSASTAASSGSVGRQPSANAGIAGGGRTFLTQKAV